MSIQSEITRIANNVRQSFTLLTEAGIDVSSTANSDNLPDLIFDLAHTVVDCGMFGETETGTVFDCGALGEASTERDVDCGTF